MSWQLRYSFPSKHNLLEAIFILKEDIDHSEWDDGIYEDGLNSEWKCYRTIRSDNGVLVYLYKVTDNDNKWDMGYDFLKKNFKFVK